MQSNRSRVQCNHIPHSCKRVCFYIAQYPVHWITLHFTPWQTCSFRHQLDFSGKHSSHACSNYTRRLFTHISSAVYSQVQYSFIQLSELGHRGENENAQILKWWHSGDSNPGSLDCESDILPVNYRAQCTQTS